MITSKIHNFVSTKIYKLQTHVYMPDSIDITRRQYDQIADCYDLFPIAAKENIQIFSELRPTPSNGRALDIGCGTGRVAVDLSKFFNEVNGIDISGKMIEIAKERSFGANNIVLTVKDARELGFQNEHFDYIVSHTTFHHLSDEELIETLNRVEQMLKPGGKIVFVDILAKGLMRNHAVLARKLGAFITLLFESFKINPTVAFKRFKLALHPIWMEHLKMDRFLTKQDFISIYGSVFKNAKFTEVKREYGLNHLMIVEWCKPNNPS